MLSGSNRGLLHQSWVLDEESEPWVQCECSHFTERKTKVQANNCWTCMQKWWADSASEERLFSVEATRFSSLRHGYSDRDQMAQIFQRSNCRKTYLAAVMLASDDAGMRNYISTSAELATFNHYVCAQFPSQWGPDFHRGLPDTITMQIKNEEHCTISTISKPTHSFSGTAESFLFLSQSST